jgi:hypothetical protein
MVVFGRVRNLRTSQDDPAAEIPVAAINKTKAALVHFSIELLPHAKRNRSMCPGI